MPSSPLPRILVLSLVSAALVAGCPTTPPAPEPTPEPAACEPSVGAVQPLPLCSAAEPCLALGPTDDRDRIEEAADVPTCATRADGRPLFDDGPPRTWTSATGLTRTACVFVPPAASDAAPLPLIVFLHGAFGSPDNVYDSTSLRSKAGSFDLSGDPARPGFVLASVQARNLHWPTADPRDGAHHDIFHRDLASPSGNPDIANLDQLIDDLVDEQPVDPSQIYVTGWSNGGFFAQLYAIARHERATPGGNRVAAAAVFSAADPFHEARAGEQPSCRLDPYPSSDVPLFIVGRACDLVACDAEQASFLADDGISIAPGAVVGTWVEDLATRVQNPNVTRTIITAFGVEVDACTGPALCGGLNATTNHVRWPDGVADGSGMDHEADMLTFLAGQVSRDEAR